ncbi:MAG: hypothetical protein V1908_04415, partial [Candidatus Peregrinibacteria bacterium]
MNVKRPLLIIGGLLLFITMVPASQASTDITGTVYGKNAGLIHLDYTTAIRPPNYAGSQRDYYISPAGSKALTPPLPTPGLSDWTAQIHDLGEESSCDADGCFLTGFLWSDAVGWIILDGKQIQNALPVPADFPEASFARVNFTGGFSGYAWSENAGWIKLASNETGGIINFADQNAENWGVYLDKSEAVVIDEQDPEDPNDDVTLGRPLHGFSWSEHLGWIKWGDESGDSLVFGAYTTWVPDATPPEFFIENNVWIKNTHPLGAVEWPVIAKDLESNIRSKDSHFEVIRDSSPDFLNCHEPLEVGFQTSGQSISITIPSIGLIQNTTLGYCKYNLTGEIFNGAGLSYKIGNPTPLTFYVRAGDPVITDEDGDEDGIEKSKVLLPLTNSAIADGKDSTPFTLSLVDVAGNPVVGIDCSGCPSRK